MFKRDLFNEDHEGFRDTVRRFIDKEIAPHHAEWEEQGYVDRAVWNKAGENGFEGLFFFGDKVKPPLAVNALIGRVPKRLADVKVPKGAESLADGRARIYYRAGFFDDDAKKQGEPAFEMSSVTLDNGIELYGTHEQSEGGIEYRITRLEALPKPECK